MKITGTEFGASGSGKASKLLGLAGSADMHYENSGLSRNVHFDMTQFPDELDDEERYHKAEILAQQRRGEGG